MKITISRKSNENKYEQTYELKCEKYHNRLLDALHTIKNKQDASLTFRSGCRSGVCGSCAVRVNGVEKLACKCLIKDGDKIEPLANYEVLRDLVVDIEPVQNKLEKIEPQITRLSDCVITKKDEKRIDKQSECILCQSCYSSCPVLLVNEKFLGPYALTKSYRYVEDKKEALPISKINAIQADGIWDCTLCGNCTMVCPQGIDPKNDILMLRNISAMNGFSDPNASLQNFGFDFGFNPNGF